MQQTFWSNIGPSNGCGKTTPSIFLYAGCFWPRGNGLSLQKISLCYDLGYRALGRAYGMLVNKLQPRSFNSLLQLWRSCSRIDNTLHVSNNKLCITKLILMILNWIIQIQKPPDTVDASSSLTERLVNGATGRGYDQVEIGQVSVRITLRFSG